jgi:two-component system, LytTR family, response regulator LytT
MQIVIIEDERPFADDLETSIRQLMTEVTDVTQLHSVRESIDYFSEAPTPDLIFSDIQLGDGLSFEIFLKVKVAAPVIFCTAYDEYALDAFKSNGIDYILKPFTTETLQDALMKYKQLREVFTPKEESPYHAVLQLLSERNTQHASSILVYQQEKIIPIKLEDIALFYLENDVTRLVTFAGKIFFPNKKLDELEKMTGRYFFRANRQTLVSRKVIVDISNYFPRKLFLNLTIPFKDKIIVSKAKTPEFLQWLSQNA